MPRAQSNLRDFARRVAARHRPRRGLLSPIVRASICTAVACGQSPRFVAECFELTVETVQRCLKLWELQQSFALRNPKSVAANPEADEPDEYLSTVAADGPTPPAAMNLAGEAGLSSDPDEDDVDELDKADKLDPVVAPKLSTVPDHHNNAIAEIASQLPLETTIAYDQHPSADETASCNLLRGESTHPSTDTALADTISDAQQAPTTLLPPTPTLASHGAHEVVRMPWGAPKTCKACTKNFQTIAYGRQLNAVRKSYFGCPDCDVALCRWGGCATMWHQHHGQSKPDLSIIYSGSGIR